MLQLFTLKNLITKLHGSPMCFQNEDHAKHEIKKYLEAEMSKEDTNPSHYELWATGSYNNEDGSISSTQTQPNLITNCSELILKETK